MGIFDFVRDSGVMGDKPATANAHDFMNDMLKKKLDQYGLEVKDARVDYNDGVVTVTGEAKDQATKEKVVLAVGNVKGVSQVDDQMTLPAEIQAEIDAAAEAAAAQFYTVKKGDSLSKIAKEFYGNAMKYPEIFEANKPMLKDPNLIYPGQVLRIPPVAAQS